MRALCLLAGAVVNVMRAYFSRPRTHLSAGQAVCFVANFTRYLLWIAHEVRASQTAWRARNLDARSTAIRSKRNQSEPLVSFEADRSMPIGTLFKLKFLCELHALLWPIKKVMPAQIRADR